MEQIAVYAIGGKVAGTGDFIGNATTRNGVMRFANEAKKRGATGVSLHGRGLSGEVSLTDVGKALDAAGIK